MNTENLQEIFNTIPSGNQHDNDRKNSVRAIKVYLDKKTKRNTITESHNEENVQSD